MCASVVQTPKNLQRLPLHLLLRNSKCVNVLYTCVIVGSVGVCAYRIDSHIYIRTICMHACMHARMHGLMSCSEGQIVTSICMYLYTYMHTYIRTNTCKQMCTNVSVGVGV